MAITTYRTIEPEYLELYSETIEEEFWEDGTGELKGVIGHAEWAYLDLEHPEVEKTVQEIILPVESSRFVWGFIYPEGDYIERAAIHIAGEPTTPDDALRSAGVFLCEGDQVWKTERLADDGDMFSYDKQSRRISRISCRGRGYEFRLALKAGDVFDDDHGKLVITMPTVQFRMRSQ